MGDNKMQKASCSADDDDDDSEGSWYRENCQKWRTTKGEWRRERRLRWTKSPEDEANYADWKIQVRYYPITSSSSKSDDNNERGDPSNKENTTAAVTETTDVVTYSVHRSSLGLKSEYFESIFLGGFSESSERHSKILPAPVVTLEHFETVLEYCYTGKVNLNCINANSI